MFLAGCWVVWEYCVSRWISIALRASRLGYNMHGHDIEVELCIVSDEVVDVEWVARVLEGALEDLDYKPLHEALPGDPLIEDLLELVYKRVSTGGLTVQSLSARLPRGRVIRLRPLHRG